MMNWNECALILFSTKLWAFRNLFPANPVVILSRWLCHANLISNFIEPRAVGVDLVLIVSFFYQKEWVCMYKYTNEADALKMHWEKCRLSCRAFSARSRDDGVSDVSQEPSSFTSLSQNRVPQSGTLTWAVYTWQRRRRASVKNTLGQQKERDFFFFVRRIPRQFFSSFFHILFDGDNELLFCLLIVCVCQQKMGGTCVRPLLVLLYDFLPSRRRRRWERVLMKCISIWNAHRFHV